MDLYTTVAGSGVQIIGVDVKTSGNEQFGQVLSASLTLKGSARPLDFWQGTAVVRYRKAVRLSLPPSGQWSRSTNYIAPHVYCALDHANYFLDSRRPEYIHNGMALIQVCKSPTAAEQPITPSEEQCDPLEVQFGPEEEPCKLEDERINVYALILKRTENLDEYECGGVARIPDLAELIEGLGCVYSYDCLMTRKGWRR